MGFCLLIDFYCLLFSGQILCICVCECVWEWEREREREREKERLFCWSPEKLFFQNFQSFGLKPINETEWLTSHKCTTMCTRHLHYLYFKVWALLHWMSSWQPPPGPRACMQRKETNSFGREVCQTLRTKVLSISRKNEQKDIRRRSSKALHEGTSTLWLVNWPPPQYT